MFIGTLGDKTAEEELVEQTPIIMLCKKVSAKMMKDKALAYKPVADDESGRAQERPPTVCKKGVVAKTVKNQRKGEYRVEYGRNLGSWRSGGRVIY